MRSTEVFLSRKWQATVRLGKVQQLLPWWVELGPVAIYTPRMGPCLIEVPSVQVGFNLLAFALGQGLGAQVTLHQPVVRLRRDERGRFHRGDPGQVEAALREAGNVLAGNVDRLEVEDATVAYEDQVLGGALTFRNVNATALGGKGGTLRLVAPIGGGEVVVYGHRQGGVLRGEIRLRTVPLPTVAALINFQRLSVRSGVLEGAIRLEYRNQRLDGAGRVRLVGGKVALAPLLAVPASFDAELRLNGSQLVLEKIKGLIAGAHLEGNGQIDWPVLDLRLDATGSLERLLPAFKVPPFSMAGQLKAAIQATVSLENPGAIRAAVQLRFPSGLSVARQGIDRFESTQHLAGSRLEGPFRFALAHGSVQGHSSVQFGTTAPGKIEIRATANSLDLDAIIPRQKRLASLQRAGRMNLAVRATGPLNQIVTTAEFSHRLGVFKGQPLAGDGRALLQGDRVKWKAVRLRWGRGRAIASGQATIMGTRPFVLRLEANPMPIALLFGSYGGAVQGDSQLVVDVKGDLNRISSFVGSGWLQTSHPTLAGLPLPPLAAIFRVRGSVLPVKKAVLGPLSAQGVLRPNLEEPRGALLRMEPLRLRVAPFDLAGLPLGLAGRIEARGTLQRTLDWPQLKLDFNLRDARVMDFQAAQSEGILEWRGTRVAVRADSSGQRLRLAARVTPHRAVRLEMLKIEKTGRDGD